MKHSFVLIVVMVAGCTHAPTCILSDDGGPGRIPAACLDGTLLGVDGDGLLAVALAHPPSAGYQEVDRLDLRLGTRTTITGSVFSLSRPVVANGEVYFLACADNTNATGCAIRAVPSAGGTPHGHLVRAARRRRSDPTGRRA